MIHRVFANTPTFREVELQKGFNVILADRTETATEKDSRNGLGKTTLVEIIHFCLGASSKKGKGLRRPSLAGWEFHLVFDAGGQRITATRGTDQFGTVFVEGETDHWPIQPKSKDGRKALAVKAWNQLLGHLLFGLPVDLEGACQPSFRSLISYFARRNADAFTDPFEHHRSQQEGDKQVHNTFLLNLSWQHAREYQQAREKEKGLTALKKAAKLGVLPEPAETLGELEARRVRLAERVEENRTRIAGFRVHKEYAEIEAAANALTASIHERTNANLIDRRRLELYQASIAEEEPPEMPLVNRVYAETGVDLPGITLRRIEEVRAFHAKIVENRAQFLAEEMARLEQAIARREVEVAELDEQRAEHLKILKSHGALEEYGCTPSE